MGDNTALTRTQFGHKMYVDTRDISLSPHILLDGFWEPSTGNVLRSIIKPGMVVVDVGANMGYFSLLMASLTGPDGKLVAFEANPEVFRHLSRNLEINGYRRFADCQMTAVMSKAGSMVFKRLRDHMGSSGFYLTEEIAPMYHDKLDEITVPCISLDEYFADENSYIDVIKIDVEGAETEVIAGARKVLERSPRPQIVMEYTPGAEGRGGNMAAIEMLVGMGFQMWGIGDDSTIRSVTFADLESAQDLMMLYMKRVGSPAMTSVDLAHLPEMRSHGIIGFADELLADASLMREYARTFRGSDDVTLVLYAPGAKPDDVLDSLRAQLVEAGFANDDGADVVLHCGSETPRSELLLANACEAVLSRNFLRAPFRDLTRVDQGDLAAYRDRVSSRALIASVN